MMRYEHNYYRTSDGSQDIEFLFVEIEPSNWRIYIISRINYGTRETGATSIHRLVEGNNALKNKINNYFNGNANSLRVNSTLYYICWSARIQTLESARNVAKAWSEITAYYIKNGGSFPSIQKILSDKNII